MCAPPLRLKAPPGQVVLAAMAVARWRMRDVEKVRMWIIGWRGRRRRPRCGQRTPQSAQSLPGAQKLVIESAKPSSHTPSLAVGNRCCKDKSRILHPTVG